MLAGKVVYGLFKEHEEKKTRLGTPGFVTQCADPAAIESIRQCSTCLPGESISLCPTSQVLTQRIQKIITQARNREVLSPSEQMNLMDVHSAWWQLAPAAEATGSDWGCALERRAHRAAESASVEFSGSFFSILPPCWLLRRTPKSISGEILLN